MRPAGENIVCARPVFVELKNGKGSNTSGDALQNFAKVFAPTLDDGEGEIPVLVKHLPGWPNIEDQVYYAVSPEHAEGQLGDQSAIE